MKSFISVLLLLLLPGLAATSSAASPGEPLINFSLPAITNNSSDELPAIELEKFKGKVIYLDFWATWCGPCRQSFPLLDNLYKNAADQGFEVVAISEDAKKKDIRKFLDKISVSFPIAWDKGGTIAKQYQLQAMPTSYIIDRQGVIRYRHYGFKKPHFAKIEKEIMSLLNE